MDIKPGEITDILKREIREYDREIDVAETGTVLNAGDGIARVYGLENVLALRGDPPKGEAAFTPTEGGFSHASELAAFVRDELVRLGIETTLVDTSCVGEPADHRGRDDREIGHLGRRHHVEDGAGLGIEGHRASPRSRVEYST